MANNQWVSADDRLPAKGWVLIKFKPEGWAVASWYARKGVWITACGEYAPEKVTHWRPLPPGPDEDEEIVTLPPAPEVKSAYNTGDGWALFDENDEPVEWPHNWPYWVSYKQMEAAGIEVV